MTKEEIDTTKVTRLEVIDHYNGTGRQVIIWQEDAKVGLSIQDEGRTLKIFITKKES